LEGSLVQACCYRLFRAQHSVLTLLTKLGLSKAGDSDFVTWEKQYIKYVSMAPSIQPDYTTLVLNRHHQQEQQAVPKFASFRAKPSNSLQVESKNYNDNSSSNTASKEAIHRKRDGDHQRSKEAGTSLKSQSWLGHGHLSRGASSALEGIARPSVFGARSLTRIDVTDEFLIDRKGDPGNIDFGGLHRSSIAQYRRSGTGSILGLPFRKIDRSSSHDRAIVLTGNGSLEARARSTLSKRSAGTYKLLRVRPERMLSNADERDADFLPLRHQTQRKKSSTEHPYDLDLPSDDDVHHYRSVHGKAKVSDQPEDEDLRYSSETSACESDGRTFVVDNMTRQKQSELNKAVEADPTNCETWLQFIASHDKMLGLNQTPGNSKPTAAERQSNAEIKLSMFAKAITAVPKSKDKERLTLAMMEETSQIWDVTKIQTKWKNLLREYPQSGVMWKRYLDSRATAFLPFKFDDVLAEFIDGFKVVGAPQKSSGDPGDLDLESTIPYLVLRLTTMMREAGFTEHAVTIWQALFEFHYFKPEGYRTLPGGPSEDTALEAFSAFENFWESEVPRVGEAGAQGWARFISVAGEPPSPKVDFCGDPGSISNVYGSLAFSEHKQTLQARRPGRAIDDVVEDDPYRVILFSDVRDFLYVCPDFERNQMLLVESFLAFCHLPPLHHAGSGAYAGSMYRDPFLRNDMLSLSRDTIKPWKVEAAGNTERPPDGTSSPFHTPVADYIVDTDTLFSATGSWFSVFDTWLLEYAQDQGPVPIDWIRRTLKALVDAGIGGDALPEYFLALELRLSPDTVTKTAKKLIRARPTSFRLYNAHVCIEFRLGHREKALQTLVAAFNTSQDMMELLQRDTIFLWHTWVWELLSSGQVKEALERLLSFSDPLVLNDRSKHVDDVSPQLHVNLTSLLRTKQALTSSRDHFLSLALPTHSYIACDLLTLLSYLSSSRSLKAAQSALADQLQALSTRFPPTSAAHELLHQTFARLLHHHATNIPLFKPATIREALTASIALFPQNTIFLSLYAWNESRFRIDDRVRTIIKDVVLSSNTRQDEIKESVTPHLFAIYSELNRSVTFGSNTNTVRNTFERAVSTSAGAHCAGIWKLYALFEHGRGEKAKAKAVWWRGVRACPWVKALWMMAFDELRDVMTDKELRGVWEMMGEKDLRLHVDLEELIERAGEK